MTRWLWFSGILLLAADLAAQPYVGSELGLAIAPSIRLEGTDNDWGTRCDLIINPAGLETGDECTTPPPPTAWANESGQALGITAGLAAGYQWGRFRFEVEYRYRGTPHEDYVPSQIGDIVSTEKADQELEVAIDGAGDVTVHGLFINSAAYLSRSPRRLSSFVGIGTGIQRMAIDYYSLWKRNDDPVRIATFEDAALRAKLAGTTTIGMAELDDIVHSVQFLGGVEFSVSERLAVGTRLRNMTGLGAFESTPREWNQLRSQDSTVDRGARIVYSVETRDTSVFILTLNLT